MAASTESARMPGSEETLILRAGSTDFHVECSALTKASTYFKALFAPHMAGLAGPTRAPDGAIIVLADPRAFRHIVTYAQYKTFPLFYEQKSGFDLGRYADVYHLAKYFGVDKLAEWIKEKKYATVFKQMTYTQEDVNYADSLALKDAHDRDIALGKPKGYEGVEEIFGGPAHSRSTGAIYRCRFEIDYDALVDTS